MWTLLNVHTVAGRFNVGIWAMCLPFANIPVMNYFRFIWWSLLLFIMIFSHFSIRDELCYVDFILLIVLLMNTRSSWDCIHGKMEIIYRLIQHRTAKTAFHIQAGHRCCILASLYIYYKIGKFATNFGRQFDEAMQVTEAETKINH